MVAGHTDEGSGVTLFLSAGTVQTHIANLFVTLGVNVRIESAARAGRHGLA